MENRRVEKKHQNIDNIDGNTVEMNVSERERETHTPAIEGIYQALKRIALYSIKSQKMCIFLLIELEFFFYFELSSIDLLWRSWSIRFQCM